MLWAVNGNWDNDGLNVEANPLDNPNDWSVGYRFTHTYEDIISVDNLLKAWKEFVQSKRRKQDVQEFARNLLANLLKLHEDLVREGYQHGPYQHFKINDPKSRDIHKALVRDRLVHHALYRQLYSFFDRTFISDS